MKKTMAVLIAIVLVMIAPARGDDGSLNPAPTDLGPVATFGKGVGRTMRLLATSTPDRRNTVRVLFYGQSITEQDWTRRVADDLRARFPDANLIIENRAIGGHSSQRLVKTAEADLYPFEPDLVIFHVYGSHIDYEAIIRGIRERTTAEIAQQLDHVTKDAALTDETDPAKLSPANWDAWMNHVFLPSISEKYGTELVDQHNLWKTYLRAYKLPAQALLKDGAHLNDHGCYLMAELVKAHLRYDASMGPATAESWVKEVPFDGGPIEFEGARVDVILKEGAAIPPGIGVRIDGVRPSHRTDTHAPTRVSAFPGSNWPCLLRVGLGGKPVAETWTLTVTEADAEMKDVRFRLAGSVTGPDGEGSSVAPFVSRSGRIRIEPDDWNLAYCGEVFRRALPPSFEVTWEVRSQGVDTLATLDREPGPGIKNVVTLARGLKGGRHRLEFVGTGPDGPIAGVRIYRPPLMKMGPKD
jgi:hypothetical protein